MQLRVNKMLEKQLQKDGGADAILAYLEKGNHSKVMPENHSGLKDKNAS